MEQIKDVYFYTDIKGKCYILECLLSLDYTVRTRIVERIERLKLGIYGDYKNIKGKLFELRFFFGKGYRIYFMHENEKIIFLLNGSNKDSQIRDIRKAKMLLTKYLEKRGKKNDKI